MIRGRCDSVDGLIWFSGGGHVKVKHKNLQGKGFYLSKNKNTKDKKLLAIMGRSGLQDTNTKIHV